MFIRFPDTWFCFKILIQCMQVFESMSIHARFQYLILLWDVRGQFCNAKSFRQAKQPIPPQLIPEVFFLPGCNVNPLNGYPCINVCYPFIHLKKESHVKVKSFAQGHNVMTPVIARSLPSLLKMFSSNTLLITNSLCIKSLGMHTKHGTGNYNVGVNPAMDLHPIQGEQIYSQLLHTMETRLCSEQNGPARCRLNECHK